MTLKKESLLQKEVKHLDITKLDVTALIDAMKDTAFQGRNVGRACDIYDSMLKDKDCTVILCLAGSLISAGMRKIVIDLIRNNMIDAIVATGANIVDQDFFEALGFKHYQGSPHLDDVRLQELAIDRIYDTLIDEDHLRICDDTVCEIADKLEAKPYSSREFLIEMGRFLAEDPKLSQNDSIVLAAYQKKLPIFCPAFSDCSAGFGLVMHQVKNKQKHVSIDSVKDFRELTEIKIAAKESGLLMMGGGVPKNFAQDIVVAAELLGEEAPLHKYAIQVTVADERDGGLSGSTLREACSWGKVSTVHEQMVYAEATLAFPLIAAYGYQKNVNTQRKARSWNELFEAETTKATTQANSSARDKERI